jgi:hypothetical protein
MARRNARPLTVRPKGLSDSTDGSNAFPGAMQQLQNLLPSASTKNVFVPRPASVLATDFPGFTTPAGGTALLVIGNRAYGMISSAEFAGKDQPFCYDIATDAFVTISGQASGNLPATQSTSGDWQPPHMEMIANRIIVTHPGFPGAPDGPYFGWIDLTGFTQTTLTGNTTSGSNVITGISGDGTSTPIFDGVQPGQTITGTNIPANTVVTAVSNGTTDISTTGTTHSSTTIDSIPASAVDLMQVGDYVSGSGVVAGTYITALPGGGTSITLSQATTSGASGVAIQVIGGGTITISNNATGSANLTALSIAGGTFADPVWSAGNTNVNPLLAKPSWVSQFNGRAYYAVGNTEVYSDSLLPLNVSLATQALTFGDNTAIIGSAGLPLSNITTGGIIQALIVIKADLMWQITGDAATGTLATNELNVSIGSLCPNTFVPTPLGLSFIAPDGLRVIDFNAHVSDPLGANGAGVCLPFINALNPSRIVSAFNNNILRISVQNAEAPSQMVYEYWLDFSLKIWTGPHTFPAQQIQAYSAGSGTNRTYRFIAFGYGINAKLWLSEATPSSTSVYTENGAQLNWSYQTVLMPDNDQMSENRMGQSAITLALPGGQSVSFAAVNEIGTVLNQIQLSAVGSAPTTWGSFVWGGAIWGQASGYFRQYDMQWTTPIVFKQMSVLISGASQGGTAIGNLYLKYQPLGYLLSVLGAPQ